MEKNIFLCAREPNQRDVREKIARAAVCRSCGMYAHTALSELSRSRLSFHQHSLPETAAKNNKNE